MEMWLVGKPHKHGDSKQTALVRVIKKLMFRVWFFRLLLVLAVAISEDSHMTDYPVIVNLWYIIFEIISAYSKFILNACFISEFVIKRPNDMHL